MNGYKKKGPFPVICEICGVSFESRQCHGKYCSEKCRKEKELMGKAKNGMPIRKCDVGAMSEYIAVSQMMLRGYEVYRNVSGHGQVDIVAIRDGSVHLFDVKTMQISGNVSVAGGRLSEAQLDRGVQRIGVMGSSCIYIDDGRTTNIPMSVLIDLGITECWGQSFINWDKRSL